MVCLEPGQAAGIEGEHQQDAGAKRQKGKVEHSSLQFGRLQLLHMSISFPFGTQAVRIRNS